MLKELFPEELNVQNNNMNNSNSSQPIPQPFPQESAPVNNQSFSDPVPISVENSIPTIEPNNAFEMNTDKKNTFHLNNNNEINTSVNKIPEIDSSISYPNTNIGNGGNNNFNNGNNNFNNVNNYNTYVNKDYKIHAASDINWKQLIKVEILGGLASIGIILIPLVISLLLILLFGGGAALLSSTLSSILSIGCSIVIAGISASIISNYLDIKRHIPPKGIFCSLNRMLPFWVTNLLIGLMILGTILIPVILVVIGSITQNGNILAIFMILGYIAMMVLIVWLALRYSLAQFLVVDGKGSIEALRTSKTLMSGYKFKLFGLILSFIGWFFVSGIFNSLVWSIFMIPLNKEFNLIGLCIGLIFMIIVNCIILLPLQVYMKMTVVEFYEDRINNGLNELRVVKKGKPILITLILSLLLTVISTGLMFLPGPKTSIQSLVNQLAPLVEQYGIQLNSNLPNTDPSNLGLEGVDPGENIITENPNTGGDVDTNNGGEDIDLNELGSGLTKIKYSVPSGYTQSYVSNNYISYADADWNDVTVTYEEGYFDLSFYEDMYPGGEHKTIAGHDAYAFIYSFDDSDSDYKEYTCYIKGTKDDDGYCIRAEKEDAFNYVLNSINF